MGLIVAKFPSFLPTIFVCKEIDKHITFRIVNSFTAVLAAADGDICTDMTGVVDPIDWTNTNPVYKQCNTALTGADVLTCMQCDGTGDFKCNTVIAEPKSASGKVSYLRELKSRKILCVIITACDYI